PLREGRLVPARPSSLGAEEAALGAGGPRAAVRALVVGALLREVRTAADALLTGDETERGRPRGRADADGRHQHCQQDEGSETDSAHGTGSFRDGTVYKQLCRSVGKRDSASSRTGRPHHPGPLLPSPRHPLRGEKARTSPVSSPLPVGGSAVGEGTEVRVLGGG